MLDVALLDGVTSGAGGCEESSEVRITARINNPRRSTAAAPAVKIVAGRLDQWSGSWS